MEDRCPKCQTPYGKIRRCYNCNGKPKTGEYRNCRTCNKSFYVERNMAKKDDRGFYCSLACRSVQRKGKPAPWAKHDKGTHPAGYITVWQPDHPRASKDGRVLEHILVMEAKLGRLVSVEEHIHHIDRNKQNNSPDNLVILSNSEHNKEHAAERRAKRSRQVEVTCEECQTVFLAKRSRVFTDNPANKKKYCSLACKQKAWSRSMEPYYEAKRGRSRRRIDEPSIPQALLRAKLEYWGYRCWICGAEDADCIDHVKPRNKYGPNIVANLRPICRSCNSSKSDKWPYPLVRNIPAF